MFKADILRPAGLYIGDHSPERDAGGVKRVPVKGVQLPGDLIVGVVRVHDVAGFQQGYQPHVVTVGVEALVVADDPPRLAGEIVDAESRPSGHADDSVKFDSGVIKDVQRPGGVHSPHGAAFQNQTGFHR